MSQSNGRIMRRLPSGIRVLIGLPTGGQWVPDFGLDLASMMAWSAGAFIKGKQDIDFAPMKREGTYTEDARNMIARFAVREGFTHILWLDTDMRFPRDVMYRLLCHEKPIVGANYSTRMPPFYPTALALVKNADGSERCWTEETSSGLEEVHAIGHGVLMVETEVYRRIPDLPWYQNYWLDAEHLVGEDVFFCRGALKAGVPIFLDHDLSHEVLHCGAMQFNLAFARQYRASELAAGREHPEDAARKFREGLTEDQNTQSAVEVPLVKIVEG